jgi:hypothetical protein
MAEKKNKKDQLKEVTTGMEPIVGVKPTVEIEGKTYTIRRLGIADTFAIVRIIGIGIKQLGQIGGLKSLDQQSMVLALVGAIPYAEDEILDLLADLVGVDGADIRNPELFPLGSEIAIIEALSKHPDLQAFFTRLQGLMKANPALQKVMDEAAAEDQ